GGLIFRIDPGGSVSVLHIFGDQLGSYSSPIFASDGNLYGVRGSDGTGGGGSVWRIRFGPTPTTMAATKVSDTYATLNGLVNPNGAASTAMIEWGISPEALTSLTQSQILEAGTTPTAISSVITGLTPATTYYFRVRADNAEQYLPQKGLIRSFTTRAVNNLPAGGSIAVGS